MARRRGKLIVLYGINNIGKTTQAKFLVKNLRATGRRAVYLKYPVYNLKPTGPLLNKILRGGLAQNMSEEELQLLFALNRYQFEPKLLKLLGSGKTVVAEDYVGTGLAWGAVKGARLPELERMNKFLVQEDMGVLLYGKRQLVAREKKHLHETNDKIVKKCEKILFKLAKKYSWEKVAIQEKIGDTAKLLVNTVG